MGSLSSTVGEILGNLGFNVNTALLVTINFLIVWFILDRFVFSRLRDSLETRQQVLEESLQNAEQLKNEVAHAEEKAEAIIAEATREANEFKAQQRHEFELWQAEAKAQAEKEIEAMRAEAREKIELERDDMLRALKAEVAELALQATRQIITTKFDASQDKMVVEQYLNQLDSK